MEWYEQNEKERIKNVYSKYTIKDFWNWWSGNINQVMEVRIKDWAIIKQVGNKYKLPYSSSGVYVWSWEQLKIVIAFVRDKATIWFGVNSRKKNYNHKGWKVFGGKDVNVDSVEFIFIDIDRINKEDRPASKQELKNCDELANLILKRLETQGWNKNYCKICSGNGLQLLIKLDIPIILPNIEFNNHNEIFFPVPNENFEKIKLSIKNGIGKNIKKFCDRHTDELQVEIDKTGFNIGRVAALPVTKNFKYGGFTWRGIVELKNEENIGLSDYILTFEDKEDIKKNIFKYNPISSQFRIKKGKLLDHNLIKFLLNDNFPKGGINNTLWFQTKCLLRDSGFDINDKEFILFHNKIKQKHDRTFTTNIPGEKYNFYPNTINNFCINNGFTPVFEIPKKPKKVNLKKKLTYDNLVTMNWELRNQYKNILEIKEDIKTEMEKCKKYLLDIDKGEYNNEELDDKANYIRNKILKKEYFYSFVNGCIKKLGEEESKKLFDNWFNDYFNGG